MSQSGDAAGGSRPAFTTRQFRDALSEFATGVTIVATRVPGGKFVGFTANSFNSVSLHPPLVVWSLGNTASTLPSFERAERYAISVLAGDQADLALRFSQPHADRFDGVGFSIGWSGAPLIEGASAWFECRHHTKVRAGDHTMFIGEVVHCAREPRPGLVFHQGRLLPVQP
jgi:flavin reductase (DIM6/NTAB) family NADH-FMN oxidoreductase RutF